MILPFGEWKPDLMNTNGETSQLVQNVVPRADGYGPFGSFLAFSGPLAEGNDSFTKVLLHFDGPNGSTTFTDSNVGGAAHTWTASGAAQISTADFAFGGASGAFTGGTSWIRTPDSTDFTLGSGDFAIDFRFKCNATSGTVAWLSGQVDNAGSAASTSFAVLRQVNDKLLCYVGQGAATINVQSTTTFNSTTNTGWHQGALQRRGNLLELYIDGVREASAPITGAVNDSANSVGVGVGGDIPGAGWVGFLDEFRLSVGTARWSANFLPPGKAYDIDTNGRCRGHFYARKTDGSIVVFAGTSTRLFKLNNTDFSWTDVSKGGLAYPALSSFEHWQFAQFGNFVVAVQANTVPQVFDISSGSAFADLGGSPPQAR
jgi:hypothetical protein